MGGGADLSVEKISCCMIIWSGKIYGHGQEKSGNLILHKEWEPCFGVEARRSQFFYGHGLEGPSKGYRWCVTVLPSHSRSLKLVPIESSYATSYWSSKL